MCNQALMDLSNCDKNDLLSHLYRPYGEGYQVRGRGERPRKGKDGGTV